ncbi:MAG: DUF6232 family protein, partial [Deltaproteobacteria bacterium]
RNGVAITTTRISIAGTTYPLSGVTAIETALKPAGRAFEYVCFLIAATVSVLGIANADNGGLLATGFGLSIGAVGAVVWKYNRDRFVLRLFTAGGQVDAVVSDSRQWIEQLNVTIGQAIAVRG